MLDPAKFKFCQEFDVVAKTIEVVVSTKGGEALHLRIDALQDLTSGTFSTKAYRKEDVTVQPTYPQTGNHFDRQPESIEVWRDYDLPWTHRDSADEAIAQALFFLGERCA